jgi:hypothetical protein
MPPDSQQSDSLVCSECGRPLKRPNLKPGATLFCQYAPAVAVREAEFAAKTGKEQRS